MKKRYILLFGLILVFTKINAQHYGLYNTGSMFDAFENPAVKTFTLDSSYKYASNFFFPTLSINAANKGDAQNVVRRAMNEHIFSTTDLAIGDGIPNTLFQHTNIYLATFRIFRHYKYNQEFGFAWQIRSDALVNYTNEGLAVIDSYRRFSDIPYEDVFTTNGYQQTYHQFSFSVRENWDKRLALGVKFSLLSGIAYNELNIDHSYLYSDLAADRLDVGIAGSYKGNFLTNNELDSLNYFPTFKNPGLSISIGTTYNSISGFQIMGNIKDLGFIRWNKKSHVAKFNTIKSIFSASTNSSNDINEEITDIVESSDEQKAFFSPTNAKADLLISRTFSFYKPSLIISKNLFHGGGDIALVNSFKFGNVTASLIPVYNFNDFIMFGVQGMYKTPNFEFFLGSDNIGKTLSTARGLEASDATIGTGYIGASIYMGMGIKFGRVVNHPMNFSTMPGVNGAKPYKGFFRSLFNLFQSKSY
jgi:hypothetical protein